MSKNNGKICLTDHLSGVDEVKSGYHSQLLVENRMLYWCVRSRNHVSKDKKILSFENMDMLRLEPNILYKEGGIFRTDIHGAVSDK